MRLCDFEDYLSLDCLCYLMFCGWIYVALVALDLVGPLLGCGRWYVITAIEVLLLLSLSIWLSLSLWFYKGNLFIVCAVATSFPIVNICVDKYGRVQI